MSNFPTDSLTGTSCQTESAREAALANVDRLARWVKNHALTQVLARQTSPIRSVGICGAGIMGSGIGVATVKHGIPIRIYDASPDALRQGIRAVAGEVACPAPNDDVASKASPAAGDLILACDALEQLGDCDLVVESVVENRELKQRVLRQLESCLSEEAILTTNTSTILNAQLATSLRRPSRFCGLHFCHPVGQRRLVEIVRGARTDDRTTGIAVDYALRIGKLPIVVQDCPGFLVNRLLLPYLNEALEMICQGADAKTIDRVARDFGMAAGPIELFDMIGTDTAMRAGRTLWEAFPDRIAITPVLPALVKRNRFGRKTGSGFYRYAADESEGSVDPELALIIEPYIRNRREFTCQEITARLILPMLVEATRVVEDGVVDDYRAIDAAFLFGLALERTRGGLLYWADRVGIGSILEWLKPLAPLGRRMQPTETLRSMAASGGRFYE